MGVWLFLFFSFFFVVLRIVEALGVKMPSGTYASKNSGLRNIQNRIDILGGRFEVISDSRKKTKLIVAGTVYGDVFVYWK